MNSTLHLVSQRIAAGDVSAASELGRLVGRALMRVHCSVCGCRWVAVAVGADDACEQLADHLTAAHGGGDANI